MMIDWNRKVILMPDMPESYPHTVYDDSRSWLQYLENLALYLNDIGKLTDDMRKYLAEFFETFDENLYDTVEDVLNVWYTEGKLKDLINTQLFDEFHKQYTEMLLAVKNELNAKIDSLNSFSDIKVVETLDEMNAIEPSKRNVIVYVNDTSTFYIYNKDTQAWQSILTLDFNMPYNLLNTEGNYINLDNLQSWKDNPDILSLAPGYYQAYIQTEGSPEDLEPDPENPENPENPVIYPNPDYPVAINFPKDIKGNFCSIKVYWYNQGEPDSTRRKEFEVVVNYSNRKYYATMRVDGTMSEWKYSLAHSDSYRRQMFQLTYATGDTISYIGMQNPIERQKDTNVINTPITQMTPGTYWGALNLLPDFVDEENGLGKFKTLEFLQFPKNIVMGQTIFVNVMRTSGKRFVAQIWSPSSMQFFQGFWNSNGNHVGWKDLTTPYYHYLKDVSDFVQKLENNVSRETINLLTITDTHTQMIDEVGQIGNTSISYDHFNAFYEMNKLLSPELIDYNFHLGDWCHGRSSRESSIVDVVKLTREFYSLKNAKGIHGNHDYNGVFDNDARYSRTSQNLKNIFPKETIAKYFTEPCGAEKGKTYYDYVDENKKIHYIFLDTFDFSYLADSTGKTYRTALNSRGIGKEQIAWLIDVLNRSEYDIIVSAHCPLDNVFQDEITYNGDTVRKIFEAFQNKQAVSYVQSDIVDSDPEISYFKTTGNVDFTTKTNRILVMLSGHRHKDESVFANGIRYVGLLCAVAESGSTTNKPPRPYFTLQDNCITMVSVDPENDVVKLYRYGAGQDYEFSLIE